MPTNRLGRPMCQAGSADDGMVTAELAVALPALVLVLALGLVVFATALAHLRCADAAEVAARLAARDETSANAVRAGQQVAPTGAIVRVAVSAATVTVTVSTRVSFPLVGRWLPGTSVVERFTQA
ncbi:MAG: hypothetical protein QOJ03_1214, partial [Frankiaceae bacterium]|nr:hypothetical protein [Frankiaceae bacterium]